MPPVGRDDQTLATHVLNVVECAKLLVASVTRDGGVDKLTLPSSGDVAAALRLLFAQTTKLQVYETRGAARGTLGALTDHELAEAVQTLRRHPVLSVEQEEALRAKPEEVDSLFTLEPEASPAPSEPAVPDDEPPPSGERSADDVFSLA